MSGVYLTGPGGPEVLEWREDIPVPVPRLRQILVRVVAAGVTGATDAVDQEVKAGGWDGALSFPRIQGGDLCGIVEKIGPGAGFKPGQRVTCPINLPRPGNPTGFIALGSEIDGAFAQYCLLEADDLYDVTASPLSDVEIAVIPCAFGTAENLLTRAGVTAGHKVLITGASCGVGLAAVQLAALRGATVWGVTSAAKAEVVPAALELLAELEKPCGAYANGFTRISDGFLKDAPTVDALEVRHDLDPSAYAAHAMDWVDQGATIIGGCCEVGPEHIQALANALRSAGHRIV